MAYTVTVDNSVIFQSASYDAARTEYARLVDVHERFNTGMVVEFENASWGRIAEMEAACRALNASWPAHQDVEKEMQRLNTEFGMHGVEAITFDCDVYTSVLYLNTGESTAPTICYIVAELTYCVASWGDLLEEHENDCEDCQSEYDDPFYGVDDSRDDDF